MCYVLAVSEVIHIEDSIYFVFLLLRRPPRSTRTATLFPYTTLFRSNSLGIQLGAGASHAARLVLCRPCNYGIQGQGAARSEEHTSELQSLMRISYAVFCLKKKKADSHTQSTHIVDAVL